MYPAPFHGQHAPWTYCPLVMTYLTRNVATWVARTPGSRRPVESLPGVYFLSPLSLRMVQACREHTVARHYGSPATEQLVKLLRFWLARPGS